MQNNDHKATLNKGTMSNKCYICDSILEAGVCVTNGHTFEADAEGNTMYTGRRPMHTIKKFAYPHGYLTYFSKMQCQICLSSLDGLLDYDCKEPLKCDANGHESYLMREYQNNKCYDVIIVVDKGVKTRISTGQKAF